MPRRNLVWILGLLLISIFSWTAVQGGLAPPHGPLQFVKGFPGQGQDYDNIALFIDVMQQVDMNYFRQLSPKDRRKFIESAINGGLRSLDDHSSFVNPKEAVALKKQIEGKFGGVGIQVVVNRETKRVVIVSPIVGTPAFRAGIRPGDEIEKVNGESLTGLDNDDVVEKISGSPGTQVVLTIRRRGTGQLIEVPLVREEILQESVLGDLRKPDQKWDFLLDQDNRIGYIRLASYAPNAIEALKQAIMELEAQKAQGLVLDLRNNPGGSLEGAVDVCDLFLEQGEIVRVEGRTDESRSHVARQAGTLFLPAQSKPIVVLINENSASASEIVAAALQDHKRAVVIGERSFGKGSVQRIYFLESGQSRLRLTTARYIRPSGKNIHRFPDAKLEDEWGVRPDVEVKLTQQEEFEWFLGRRDRDIVRDAESDRIDQSERAASAVSPLTILPHLTGPLGIWPGLVETNTSLSTFPRTTRPYRDQMLEKALELIRQKLSRERAA